MKTIYIALRRNKYGNIYGAHCMVIAKDWGAYEVLNDGGNK